jgi:hypothetical protein
MCFTSYGAYPMLYLDLEPAATTTASPGNWITLLALITSLLPNKFRTTTYDGEPARVLKIE